MDDLDYALTPDEERELLLTALEVSAAFMDTDTVALSRAGLDEDDMELIVSLGAVRPHTRNDRPINGYSRRPPKRKAQSISSLKARLKRLQKQKAKQDKESSLGMSAEEAMSGGR